MLARRHTERHPRGDGHGPERNVRSGGSLYAGNCSTCHGAPARGGRNGLGVSGPDIACTESADYQEKVRYGGDGMPPFPALTDPNVGAIMSYVRGDFCTGD